MEAQEASAAAAKVAFEAHVATSIALKPTFEPYRAAFEAHEHACAFEAVATEARPAAFEAQNATPVVSARPLLLSATLLRIAGRSVEVTALTALDAHVDVFDAYEPCAACIVWDVIDRFEAYTAAFDANSAVSVDEAATLDAKDAALLPNRAALLEKAADALAIVDRLDANFEAASTGAKALQVHADAVRDRLAISRAAAAFDSAPDADACACCAPWAPAYAALDASEASVCAAAALDCVDIRLFEA